jgi:predicted ATPase/transcriptional regulator with XRE-family HTH domain
MDTAEDSDSTFGMLLRRFRLATGLSQEGLAERAGMSARGISDLERGIHRAPYQQTLIQLLDALGLDGQQRAMMTAAARRTGRATAGPARRGASPWHNLPEEATSFIGRTAELAALEALLRRPGARLVTLTGPGGSGKTRLALRAAAGSLAEFTDGVCFVSLATLTGAQEVASAIATALRLRERDGHGPTELVLDHLRERHVLLVLDSFEHLAGAAFLLPVLLNQCPRLRLLVTSRAVLQLSWEFVFEVQPLAVPGRSDYGDDQALARYDGVALFAERARAANSAFVLTAENARAIAEICSRLDGLPLALELAAARLRVLSPQALLRRLSSRLTLLTGGAADRPSRQQTLRAAIDWSYSLLDDSEQRLFARLAVFAGGCTMEAAEAVCSVSGNLAVDVLDGVASLVDKSLLRRLDLVSAWRPAVQQDSASRPGLTAAPEPADDPEPHLGMLETIREYGLERLAGGADEPLVRRRHAEYFLSLAEQAAGELGGAGRAAWLSRLEAEHDNLRVALRWSEEHQEVRTGLRLAVALGRFWELRGHLSEGARWLTELLAAAGDEAPELRAAALKTAGSRAFASDFAAAGELTEQSMALYRELGDQRGLAETLHQRGIIAFYLSDYGRAALWLAESVALARSLGDTDLVNRSLWSLARPNTAQGDISETKKLAEQSLELSRQLRDPAGAGAAMEALMYVARLEGDQGLVRSLLQETLNLLRHSGLHPDVDLRERLERMAFEMTTIGSYEHALTLIEEGIALCLRSGDRRDAAHLGCALALFAREQGRFDRAGAVLEESLAVFRELQDVQGAAVALIGLADVARDQGDGKRAMALSQEGLALARECGDTPLAGYALHNMGVGAWQQGFIVQAQSLLAAALAAFQPSGDGRAEVLASIGVMALDQADFAAARRAFADSLSTERTRDIPWLISADLEGLAEVAVGQGQPELAARLFGAADAIRAASGTPVPPGSQQRRDLVVAAARAAQGPELFDRACQQGHTIPVEQLITDATGGVTLS